MSGDEVERRGAAERMLTRVNGWFPSVGVATLEQVERWRGEGRLLLVDVREDEEMMASTIEGSVNQRQATERLDCVAKKQNSDRPGGSVQERAAELRNEQECTTLPVEVVCFCTVGFRSGVYAQQLCKRYGGAGVRVHNYSVLSHVWGGGALSGASVHVYSGRYGKLFPGKLGQERFGTVSACWRALRWLGQTCITSVVS